jgi:alkylation response protein AidB-like acyl-CoA dehydrogenase
MGRVLLPGPFRPTVVSSGLSVLRYGNEAQKREILPKVSSGEFILTFALTEQKASFDVQGIETKAEKTKEGFSLTGTKRFVPDAHVADKILCVAKIEAEEAKVEEGITVFICDLPSEGIEITPLKTLAGDKQCEVVFRDVQVPQENILGEVGKGWEIVEQVKERTIVAICALMAGAARTVVDMSVDYAKQRVQFNRHIGSFQAIQQKCVDMLIATEAAQYLMYQAAWKLDNNLPARQEISMAKAWASDMFREKVWMEGIRVHGGLGLTIDHDIPLYYLRGKAWELMLGDGDYHWNIVADEMKL